MIFCLLKGLDVVCYLLGGWMKSTVFFRVGCLIVGHVEGEEATWGA
jgi:hypothetical protein